MPRGRLKMNAKQKIQCDDLFSFLQSSSPLCEHSYSDAILVYSAGISLRRIVPQTIQEEDER
jgi:hypothetical protein